MRSPISLGPARDHVRHQAAERAAREQHRHTAEEDGDGRDEPLLHQGLVDSVADRLDPDRRRGVQASDGGPHGLNDRSACRRADLGIQAALLQDRRCLQVGQVDDAALLFLEALVDRVADDADHFDAPALGALAHPQMLANRIVTAEERRGHRRVDHGHRGTALAIARREVASGDQRRAHRREKAGRHGVEEGPSAGRRRPAPVRRSSFDAEDVEPVSQLVADRRLP